MKNTTLFKAMIALIIAACAHQVQAIENPSDTKLRKRLLNTCLIEAQWLITHTAQYKNGSIRTKRQLRSSNNTEVTSLKTLCSQMSKATPKTSEILYGQCTETLKPIQKNHGDEATLHVERMTKICRLMTTV